MSSRKKKKIRNQNFFDYTLLFVVIFLILFGLVMIYSTSSYDAANDFGDSTYYLRKQLLATFLGIPSRTARLFCAGSAGFDPYRNIGQRRQKVD